MVAFRSVRYPKRLVATPMTMADIQTMDRAETHSTRGVSVAARLVSCKYVDDTTFVVPVDSAIEPFKMNGYVAADDVASWFEWKYAAPAEEPAKED